MQSFSSETLQPTTLLLIKDIYGPLCEKVAVKFSFMAKLNHQWGNAAKISVHSTCYNCNNSFLCRTEPDLIFFQQITQLVRPTKLSERRSSTKFVSQVLIKGRLDRTGPYLLPTDNQLVRPTKLSERRSSTKFVSQVLIKGRLECL
ncbi:hypothetical protein CDAR_478201 [Caerostris darwini]|uniref:Uncharacterized protein n=1 Tax=Caerostris darwini TaxID=1538125 RepID=A0AAV4UK96_9ARAC|nr:hypothetical protein CDAR_478201 [Caerostris darwini]